MADLWLPDVERIVGQSAGAMSGAGGRKLLLHSTEGTTIAGALAAYRARNVWPTLTVDCRRRRPVEHLPLNVAARALKNLPGGVETNRGGRVLVQIELIGFAGNPPSIGTPADLDWFGAEVVAPICQLTGIPLVTSVRWVPYPSSYGVGQGQRLTGQAWLDYSGLIGHQHVPENDHGDPGALDVTRILAAARTLLEDDMTPAECNDVLVTAITTPGHPFRAELGKIIDSRFVSAKIATKTDADLSTGEIAALVAAFKAELGGTADEAAIESALRRVLAGVKTTGHFELTES